MADQAQDVRGMTASTLQNETSPPGLIFPTPVSGVEGSEESLSAGIIALPEDSPLTGDATNSATSTSTTSDCGFPGPSGSLSLFGVSCAVSVFGVFPVQFPS